MANDRNDSNGYTGLNDDTERDMGAKGGSSTTLGTPDDKHNISRPYNDDTQTQLAAKSTKKKNTADNLNEDWKTGQDSDKKIANNSEK